MKLMYSVSHAIIQSGLAELILVVYRVYETQSIPEAIGSSAILMMLIGLYGTIFGLLLYNRGETFRLVIASLLSSLFTTLTIMFYPQVGFVGFAWWTLFLVLIFAAFLAHGVLYGAGARMNPRSSET